MASPQADSELTTLVAAFERPGQLETACNLLLGHGIEAARITTVARPDTTTGARAARRDPRPAATGAVTGAMLGTYFGAALGPFFPAGTVAGGLIGLLVGAGFSRSTAEDYGERLLSGDTILLVRARPEEVEVVERVLRQAEAQPAPADLLRTLPVEARSAEAPDVGAAPKPPAPAPGDPGERELRAYAGNTLAAPYHVTYGHTGRGRQTSYGFRGPNFDHRGEVDLHSDP